MPGFSSQSPILTQAWVHQQGATTWLASQSLKQPLRLSQRRCNMSFRRAGMVQVMDGTASGLKRKRFRAPNARLTTGGQVRAPHLELSRGILLLYTDTMTLCRPSKNALKLINDFAGNHKVCTGHEVISCLMERRFSSCSEGIDVILSCDIYLEAAVILCSGGCCMQDQSCLMSAGTAVPSRFAHGLQGSCSSDTSEQT